MTIFLRNTVYLMVFGFLLSALSSGCKSKKKDPRDASAVKIHSGPVTDLAFSPDGDILASAGDDSTIRLLQVENGRFSTSVPPELDISPLRGIGEGFTSVAFSPDGLFVFAGEYQNLRGGIVDMFDLTSGTLDSEIEISSSKVSSIASHPTTAVLAVASGEGRDFGGMDIIDLDSGSITNLVDDIFAGVRQVTFSPDGAMVAGAGLYDAIRVHSLPDGEEIATLESNNHHPQALAFSPDGRYIASCGDETIDPVSSYRGTVYLWEVSTGELIRFIEVSSLPLRTVAFSPNGELIAAGGDDHLVYILGALSYRVLDSLRGHVGPVNAVAFSPEGSTLISGSDDSYLHVWTVDDLTDEALPDTASDLDSDSDSETGTAPDDTSTSTETTDTEIPTDIPDPDGGIDSDTTSQPEDTAVYDTGTETSGADTSLDASVAFDAGPEDTETETIGIETSTETASVSSDVDTETASGTDPSRDAGDDTDIDGGLDGGTP